MDVELIKKLIKALNWKKLDAHLLESPLSEDDVENLVKEVYHSDSMVRRRPNDTGMRRNQFLDALESRLRSSGFTDAVEAISDMRIEFEAIDTGYAAVFESERLLPTSQWTGPQRIAATLTMLQSAAKKIHADIGRSLTGVPALIPEPVISDLDGNRYNPNAVVHNLAAAAFNIFMMEAYRENYFNVEDEIVMPALPAMAEREAEPIVGNYATAHLWKLWKNVDEKTRFLAGQIKVIHDKPIWVGSNDKRLEDVDTTLEFEANLEAEALVVIAGERFDERQRQTLFRLITETNLSSKVALNSDATVDLPPASFLSIEEG